MQQTRCRVAALELYADLDDAAILYFNKEERGIQGGAEFQEWAGS